MGHKKSSYKKKKNTGCPFASTTLGFSLVFHQRKTCRHGRILCLARGHWGHISSGTKVWEKLASNVPIQEFPPFGYLDVLPKQKFAVIIHFRSQCLWLGRFYSFDRHKKKDKIQVQPVKIYSIATSHQTNWSQYDHCLCNLESWRCYDFRFKCWSKPRAEKKYNGTGAAQDFF